MMTSERPPFSVTEQLAAYRLYLDDMPPEQRDQYDAGFLESMREAIENGNVWFEPMKNSFGLIGEATVYYDSSGKPGASMNWRAQSLGHKSRG